MASTFYIKQGDTDPDLTATLTDADGNAIDLSPAGTAVRFHMGPRGGTTVKVDAAAVIADAANGVVRHEWIPADTDEAGDFNAEFQVTWPDGSIQTYPNDDYILVKILKQVA